MNYILHCMFGALNTEMALRKNETSSTDLSCCPDDIQIAKLLQIPSSDTPHIPCGMMALYARSESQVGHSKARCQPRAAVPVYPVRFWLTSGLAMACLWIRSGVGQIWAAPVLLSGHCPPSHPWRAGHATSQRTCNLLWDSVCNFGQKLLLQFPSSSYYPTLDE